MKLEKTRIKKIVDYFSKKPEVAAVYLYGSYARGDARANSDIDLAVLVTDKRKYTGFGIVQVVFAQDLSKITDKKVDVVDLDDATVDFAHRVLSESILLISSNDKARIKFEEKTLRVYFDLKPAIEEYYKHLSEITKRGDLGVRFIQN